MEISEDENGPKSLGFSKSYSNREVYSNIGLLQEARKTSNNLNLPPREPGKEEQKEKKNPKTRRRKEIILGINK